MNEIGVALVGYGQMGVHHCAQIIQVEGLRLHTVCDEDHLRRKEVRKKHDVNVAASLEEVLDDPQIDLVVLVTPHHTHAPATIQALKAGRHVVVEKVMCLSVNEADAMIEAAEKANRTLTVHHNRRQDSDYLMAKQVVESGVLGEIYRIEAACNYRGPHIGWRTEKRFGGGYVYDAGGHMADQLVQIVKAPVRTVFADMQYRVWSDTMDTETYANICVRFENGLVGVMEISGIMWHRKPRFIIMGEKGTFVAVAHENFGEADGIIYTETAGHPSTIELHSLEQKNRSNPILLFYQQLAAHLLRGSAVPVKPEEVRESIKIIEAAFLSAETGKSVEVQGD